MKALAYERAHELKDFAIRLMDVPEPALRDADLLVEVRAIGINPGEAFIRRMRSAEPGGRVILGWEFAGVVTKIGPAVKGFKAGDRVFGTGDMSRDGCWAERVAVDHRIIARLPDDLSFGDAASLPVGTITAWEALFRDRETLAEGVDRVLIVGGAGAVGSLATLLLKARTNAFVISTASRPESSAWCRKMGADLVIDHSKDLAEQLDASGYRHVDLVLSTAGSVENLGKIVQLLRPFGQLSITDGAPTLDPGPLMSKSITLNTEMIFSRVLAGYDLQGQAYILETAAALIKEGSLRSIMTARIDGLSVEAMRAAHESIETRRTVGKIVIVV